MVLVPKKIEISGKFIGREFEQQRLREISDYGESAIITVYGRRRIGKTELLEQTFRDRKVLKFEGIQAGGQQEQMEKVMWQLAIYANEPILASTKPKHWSEVLKAIADKTAQGEWTVYFEEVQWLANYKPNFIAELKYVWDNYFRYNNELILIPVRLLKKII